jgi:hypothetical protein
MNLSSRKRRVTIPPMTTPTTSVSRIATLLHAPFHSTEISQAGLSPPAHHPITITFIRFKEWIDKKILLAFQKNYIRIFEYDKR